jgi:hypothetical protein
LQILEKIASSTLADLAPRVHQLYARFSIDNAAQESMLAAIDADGVSVFQATCAWLRDSDNSEVWRPWIPPERLVCDVGNLMLEAENRCVACPQGSVSAGGRETQCTLCAAGRCTLASIRTDLSGVPFTQHVLLQARSSPRWPSTAASAATA